MVETLRCRYSDCPEGHEVIPDEQEDDLRVTCPTCRDDLGLPSVEEADRKPEGTDG